MRLEDPILDRSISSAYTVQILPSDRLARRNQTWVARVAREIVPSATGLRNSEMTCPPTRDNSTSASGQIDTCGAPFHCSVRSIMAPDTSIAVPAGSNGDPPTPRRYRGPIIDCDVHQSWADDGEIQRRLPAYFQQPWAQLASSPWPSPIGVFRADAVPKEGGPAGFVAGPDGRTTARCVRHRARHPDRAERAERRRARRCRLRLCDGQRLQRCPPGYLAHRR